MENIFLPAIISAIIITSVGTFLHFTYALSREREFVALFSATNESTWEHIKMALVPTVIFGLIMAISGSKNAFVATAASLLSLYILIPVLFYSIKALMGRHSVIASIIEFFISILFSQFIFFSLTSIGFVFPAWLEATSAVLLCFLIATIPVFTLFPPKFSLWKDPTNGKYGLAAHTKKKHGKNSHR